MSGMMYEDGAVITFIPEPVGSGRMVETFRRVGDEKKNQEVSVLLGWGVIVTHRDNWVIETEVQPMIECCGSVVAALEHCDDSHRSKGEYHYQMRILASGEVPKKGKA